VVGRWLRAGDRRRSVLLNRQPVLADIHLQHGSPLVVVPDEAGCGDHHDQDDKQD
jgi:hypothetical protein